MGEIQEMKAASIVLFNPDNVRLTDNINSIIEQVDRIILVDNGDSSKTTTFLENILCNDKIKYINNGGNKGIAYALNRAVEYCLNNNIEWLLTLDQDSICPSNIISVYEQYAKMKDISIVCCAVNYNDQEIVDATVTKSEKYTYVESCITSASYININDCMRVGGFDERMFIDRVDFEYCHRILKAGKKILQTNEIVLAHQLGDLQVKYVGGRNIHVGGHSAFRKYYMAQNLIYCHRKHPEYNSFSFCLIKIVKLIVKTLVYEDQKIKKVTSIVKGISKGVFMPTSTDNWIKSDGRRIS